MSSTKAEGKFEVTGWNEDVCVDPGDGHKLTRASVTQDFEGDIAGSGSVEWLMCYRPDGTAHFVGLQRIDAALGEATGTFVVDSVGEYDGKLARGRLVVVPGSGTGALATIRGKGAFAAPMGSSATYELEYELG